MDLVLKVRDLITAVRSQDWPTAIRLTLEIITIITQGLSPQPMFSAKPKMKSAFAAAESKNVDDLANDLESCCNQHAPTGTVAATGPFIDLLLPLCLAILRKLLGF